MDFLLVAFYSLLAVAVAIAGAVLEPRHKRLGIALLFVSLALVLNLFAGGAVLFVPLILAIYGVIFGLPALAVWLLVRWWRRRRGARGEPAARQERPAR